jgi:hypothetical protein
MTLLESAQAQKEVTINSALNLLDGQVLVYKGLYSSSAAYKPNAVVKDGAGAHYVCILAGTGQALTNASYWTPLGGGGAGGSLTIQDDGASQGTAGTLNFGTGVSATVSGGVATITASGGGGGYGIGEWAPSPADAYDDEFNSGTLDTTTKWSWVNQAGATGTLGRGHLRLAGVSGSALLHALVQPVSGATWRVETKLALPWDRSNHNVRAGLYLYDSVSTKLEKIDLMWQGTYHQIGLERWTNPSTYSSSVIGVTMPEGVWYLAAEKTASGYKYEVSQDGANWWTFHTTDTAWGAYDRVGPGLTYGALPAGKICVGSFNFCRKVA